MKPKLTYIIIGFILGGIILPALLHPLKITVFASTTDIVTHLTGGLIGILISLIIYKLKNKG